MRFRIKTERADPRRFSGPDEQQERSQPVVNAVHRAVRSVLAATCARAERRRLCAVRVLAHLASPVLSAEGREHVSDDVLRVRHDPFVIVPNDDEKYLPTENVGQPIAANYFCRFWNPKRNKYCGARAGFATEHPGVGRCKRHGGTSRIKHGLRSRYHVLSPSMQERFGRHASDPELLDMRNEIVVLAALLDEALDSETLDREICARLAEAVSKAKDRLHSNNAKHAFSIEQAKRWFFGVDRIIDVRVTDLELANQIKADILAIGV